MLNAYRNFLKTNEDIEWYSSTCLNNLDIALTKAIEQNDICDENCNKEINDYINEVRKCNLSGFDKHWKRLSAIEQKRINHKHRYGQG